jgi:short-subunit dehydrogenase
VNRRILITGASAGLGRELALALAAAGTELILTGRRMDALDNVAETARASGASVRVHELELGSAEEVLAFGNSAAAEPAGLDALIHNAALIKLGTLADTDASDLDSHYRVNLRAPVVLTRSLLGRIQKARGQVVFINSAAGLAAHKGAAFYAATKHALKAVADSLREETAPEGITVLSVFLSRMNTPMQERVLKMEGGAADLNSFLQPAPTARAIVQAMEACRRGELGNLTLRIGQEPQRW